MPNPRVLISTYHQAFLVRGGGEAELITIEDRLKQAGLIADIYGPYSRNLDAYDIALHFSVHGGGLALLEEISDRGIPIALWPNFWATKNQTYEIDTIARHVELAEVVIFKSAAEEKNFTELVSIPAYKLRRAAPQAHRSFLKPTVSGLFKSLYNIDGYAIWYGAIEPSKNQLAAIRVLREKDIPLVIVGHSRNDEYYQECVNAGGASTIFIPDLPYGSDIVRSALTDAAFYIEVPFEPPGLSAIEAGLSGSKLVLSESDWTREQFGDLAFSADPSDDCSIGRAIDNAMAAEYDRTKARTSLSKFCTDPLYDSIVEILREMIR